MTCVGSQRHRKKKLLVTVVFFIPYEHCTVRPPNADGGDNLRISANVLNKQSGAFQLKDCAGVTNNPSP
jgi:hypothetical protein